MAATIAMRAAACGVTHEAPGVSRNDGRTKSFTDTRCQRRESPGGVLV